MSLMLAHQKKVKESGTSAAVLLSKGTTFPGGKIGARQLANFLTAALKEDLNTLHGITSIQRKIEFKKSELIPKYREYIPRLKSAGFDHELLVYFLIWLLDAKEIAEAVEHGLYCVDRGLSMPERFSTDLKTFFVGAVCCWAEDELSDESSASPYLMDLYSYVDAEKWDIADAVMAKLLKCMGMQSELDKDPGKAIHFFEQAETYGAKVKTKLNKLRKKIN